MNTLNTTGFSDSTLTFVRSNMHYKVRFSIDQGYLALLKEALRKYKSGYNYLITTVDNIDNLNGGIVVDATKCQRTDKEVLQVLTSSKMFELFKINRKLIRVTLIEGDTPAQFIYDDTVTIDTTELSFCERLAKLEGVKPFR